VRKRDEPEQEPRPESRDTTREALDFCFEDVSSLRMLGAAPLSDLTSRPGPAAPASGAGPAEQRGAGQRWNLVVLAALLLTLGAATALMLFAR
jgi:hypothetical protein